MADKRKTIRFWTYSQENVSCNYVRNTSPKYWTAICNTQYIYLNYINCEVEFKFMLFQKLSQ